MKIKLKISIASAEWSYAPGQVVEVSEPEGVAWIEAGIAEAISDHGDNEIVALDAAKAKKKGR